MRDNVTANQYHISLAILENWIKLVGRKMNFNQSLNQSIDSIYLDTII